MKVKFSILIALVLMLFFACNKEDSECKTKYLGEFPFAQETKEFYIYKDAQRLIFRDSSGHEYVFKKEVNIDNLAIDTEFNTEIGCYTGNKGVEFKRDAYRITFSGPDENLTDLISPNDKIIIEKFVGFQIGEEDYELNNLMDFFTISVFDYSNGAAKSLNTIQLNIITSNRGNGLDIESINNEAFDYVDSINFFGNTYEEIYQLEGLFNRTLSYSKKSGIVSFVNSDNVHLFFDKIE